MTRRARLSRHGAEARLFRERERERNARDARPVFEGRTTRLRRRRTRPGLFGEGLAVLVVEGAQEASNPGEAALDVVQRRLGRPLGEERAVRLQLPFALRQTTPKRRAQRIHDRLETTFETNEFEEKNGKPTPASLAEGRDLSLAPRPVSHSERIEAALSLSRTNAEDIARVPRRTETYDDRLSALSSEEEDSQRGPRESAPPS